MSFKLIDTNRDGRVIRQTYVKELGPAGCLVLVSTTVYSSVERPASPGSPAGSMMKTDEMIKMVPIDMITESLAYVPGIKLGNNGLEQIDGFDGTPEPAPQVPESDD